LVFGFVSAQLQGVLQPAPSPKPRQKPKILAAQRYIFSVNAPASRVDNWPETVHLFKVMPKFLIKVANVAWLVIIFIGVPAITHAQVGNWHITQASTARALIFGGLVLAAVTNTLLAMTIKKQKDRVLCWEWVAAFGGLLIVEFAYTNGYLNFNWLRRALQWVQAKL
jgi:uncharacterized membrane protein